MLAAQKVIRINIAKDSNVLSQIITINIAKDIHAMWGDLYGIVRWKLVDNISIVIIIMVNRLRAFQTLNTCKRLFKCLIFV